MPTISSAAAHYSVLEGTTSSDPNFLTWTIELSEASAQEVTVDFRILGGTGGFSTSDYGVGQSDVYRNPYESTLTFAAGETSRTISYRVDADALDELDESLVLELFDPVNATLQGGEPVQRHTGWVLDDDGGADRALFVSSPVIREDDSGQKFAVFELSLSRESGSSMTFNFATRDGSARAGEDYVATSGSVVFSAGQLVKTVSVPISGDTTPEEAERFFLDVDRPSGVQQVTLGAATIIDDDSGTAEPTINLSRADMHEATTSSDPQFLSWTVTLDRPSLDEVAVSYRLLPGLAGISTAGFTAGGSDLYANPIESRLVFARGETSKTITYRIDADSVDEPDENVFLELFHPAGAALSGNGPVLRQIGWIQDDDGSSANIALAVSRPVIVEGDATRQAVFEISLSRPAPADMSLTWSTVDGTARAGEDYAAASGTVHFVAGQTMASVVVTILADDRSEMAETFTLDIQSPPGFEKVVLGEATILDDDASDFEPTLSVTATDNHEATTSSDPQFLTWTVSLDRSSTDEIGVRYRIVDGTGTSSSAGYFSGRSDIYRNPLENTLIFGAGETSRTVSYRIDGDGVDEFDEHLTLELYDASGAVIGGGVPVLRSTAWIRDDDGSGANIALAVSSPVVQERDSGQREAVFEISLSRPATADMTVAWSTRDNTARAGEDYAASSGTVTFVEGQTRAAVTVPVYGDMTHEGTETFTLAIDGPPGITTTTLGEAEILDDDSGRSVPTINVSAASSFEYTTSSDPQFLSWTVTLDRPVADEVTVGYSFLSGTAGTSLFVTEPGSADVYQNPLGNVLTFLAGQTSRTIAVRIDGDNIDERDETVVLELANARGGVLATGEQVLRSTGWILDDDGTGSNLALAVSNPVIREGDGGTKVAEFEVTLSRPAAAGFSVAYTTRDISAVAGQDYVAASGTLTFVEGQSKATVSVAIAGDLDIETTETFALDIDTPPGVAQVSLGTATILDDDAGGRGPTLSVAPTSNFEASTSSDPQYMTWTLTLDRPAMDEVTVQARLAPGTGNVALNDINDGTTDVYNSPLQKTVTFLAGQTTQQVSWRIDADSVDERDETVQVELFDAQNATLAGQVETLRAVGWLRDDDGTGRNVGLHVGGSDVYENVDGGSTAVFHISLSEALSFDTSFAYTTLDGSAVAGSDYVAKSGTVTFVAGQTEAAVAVEIRGDGVVENDEFFSLDVTSTGAVSTGEAGTLASITIHDNGRLPGAPVATGETYSVARNGSLVVSGLAGVLTNDRDTGEALTAFLKAGPQHGTLVLSANGGFTYTPDAGYFGADRFSYFAEDGEGDMDAALVSLNVMRPGVFALDGTAAQDFLEGTLFADDMRGLAGADTLIGFAGNDTLEGGAGGDRLVGGDGTDTASYAGSAAWVNVSLLTGYAGGGAGSHAVGDAFVSIENLRGSAMDDRLNGNAAANVLEGGAGADRLDGNAGRDTASYAHAATGVAVFLANASRNTGEAAGDVYLSIEDVTGSAHNDRLGGNAAGNVLRGGAGFDIADYGLSPGFVNVSLLTGYAGGGGGSHALGDTLIGIEGLAGSAGSDRLSGDDGNNILAGRAGADTLDGNGGDDLADYSESAGWVNVSLMTGFTGGGGGSHAIGDVLLGIEALRGSDMGDRLTGDDGENTITGGAGADYLRGEGGGDVLSYVGSAGAVNVSLDSGFTGGASGSHAIGDDIAQFEHLWGSVHADRLSGDDGANWIRGGAGGDYMRGLGGIDTLDYFGSAGFVNVSLATGYTGGGAGSHAIGDDIGFFENLRGSDFDDILSGDNGSNVFFASRGNDRIDGRSSQDTVDFEFWQSGVIARLGADGAAEGADGRQTLISIESLRGTDFADRLAGDGGANVLEGRGGADHLFGYSGIDTADYADSTAYVNISLATGFAGGGSGSHSVGDILSGIENLSGSAFDDLLNGDGGANVLTGRAGADRLDGNGGRDTAAYADSAGGVNVSLLTGYTGGEAGSHAIGDTLISIENLTGSDRDDILSGDHGANVLTGRAGNDRLIGNGGGDTLSGGAGVDWADYGTSAGAVNISLATGYTGGAAGSHAIGDRLFSIENLAGSRFDDLLNGDGGANTLAGRDGADVLRGYGGADTADYSESAGFVNVSIATGYAGGGAGSHAIGDTLISIENLIGSRFGDRLGGDGGTNVITGGRGNDVLFGRGGADTFVFRSGDGQDVVSDFENGADLFDLRGHSGVNGFADLTVTVMASLTRVTIANGDRFDVYGDFGQVDQADFLF